MVMGLFLTYDLIGLNSGLDPKGHLDPSVGGTMTDGRFAHYDLPTHKRVYKGEGRVR